MRFRTPGALVERTGVLFIWIPSDWLSAGGSLVRKRLRSMIAALLFLLVLGVSRRFG
jgi:hypothetical protein